MDDTIYVTLLSTYVEQAFQHLVSVETHPNGGQWVTVFMLIYSCAGATILVIDWVATLRACDTQDKLDSFVEQVIRLGFLERPIEPTTPDTPAPFALQTTNGGALSAAYFAMTIIRGGCQHIPELIDYMGNTHPSMPINVGNMFNKQESSTMTCDAYRKLGEFGAVG